MRNLNRRYDDPKNDCTLVVITMILLISFTLIFHEEIWVFIDWTLTTTEQFHASR